MSSVNLDNTMSTAAREIRTPSPNAIGRDQGDEGTFDEHLKQAAAAEAEPAKAETGAKAGEPDTSDDSPKTNEGEELVAADGCNAAPNKKENRTNEQKPEGKKTFPWVAPVSAEAEIGEKTLDEVAELSADAQAMVGQPVVEKNGAVGPKPTSKQMKAKVDQGAAGAVDPQAKPAQDSTPTQAPTPMPTQTQVQSQIEAVPCESAEMPEMEIGQQPAQSRAARQPEASGRRRAAEKSETAEPASRANADGLPAVSNEVSTEVGHGEATEAESLAGSKETAGQEKVSPVAGQSGSGERTSADPAPKAAPEATQTGGNRLGEQNDGTRFVQRVAQAFQSAGEGNGSVRIRLHPPELGSLDLELTVRDGRLTARMETETQTARNLLLEHLPALRERLAQYDIKIERFDVEYQQGGTGGSPQGASDGEQRQDQPGRRARWADERERETAGVLPRQVVLPPGEGTRLNVLV